MARNISKKNDRKTNKMAELHKLKSHFANGRLAAEFNFHTEKEFPSLILDVMLEGFCAKL